MTASDIPTITRPIADFESPKRSCTDGIWATQVPTAAPLTKKIRVVAQRGDMRRARLGPGAAHQRIGGGPGSLVLEGHESHVQGEVRDLLARGPVGQATEVE